MYRGLHQGQLYAAISFTVWRVDTRKVLGWPFRFPKGMGLCVAYETVKRDTVLRLLSNCVPGLVPMPIEEKPCVGQYISG